MSYIQENLMPKEKVLFQARVHPVVFSPIFVGFVLGVLFFVQTIRMGSRNDPVASVLAGIFLLLTLFMILLMVFSVIYGFILLLTTEFAVTNRRVIAKTGFIRRHTIELLLSKVESVSVKQNILGRLLNFGTVTITGTGGTQESFLPIVGPIVVRKKINQIIEAYMQAYNRYQQQQASNPKMDG